MPPPKTVRGRPADNRNGLQNTTDTPPPNGTPAAKVPVAADVLANAAELIGTQHERDHAAERRGFNRGYDLGRRDGWRAGYAKARQEEDDAWAAAARRVTHGPSYDEMDRRRYPPGGRLSWIQGEGGDAA